MAFLRLHFPLNYVLLLLVCHADVPGGSFIVRDHIPMSNLFSCLWFNEVDRFTSRDQLSFAYSFLKLKRMNPDSPFFLNMFKGILLSGAPGTGRKLLAKAIAGQARVLFFYRAGLEYEEMFVGIGARRVRSLFQAAKKKGIILMAATNLPDILDPALTRPGRFDRHIVVPIPDVRGRQEILDLYLQEKPLADDVDVKAIACGTPEFNRADTSILSSWLNKPKCLNLANLVNIAAIKAAVEGTEEPTAAQLEFAKDRIMMCTERKKMFVSEESKKLTAYHESGHAFVAFNTDGAHPIHKVTIMPRGSALGMVTQLPSDDETSISRPPLAS